MCIAEPREARGRGADKKLGIGGQKRNRVKKLSQRGVFIEDITLAARRYEISLRVLSFFNTRREISYLRAAM